MMRRAFPLAALLAFAPRAGAQQPPTPPPAPANLDFEAGALPFGAPAGWSWRPQNGYSLIVTDSGAFQGRWAALLARAPDAGPAGAFGTMTQGIAADRFRGQRVRWRAYVRVDLEPPAWAGLWVRVDRPQRMQGFFDNMQDRSITGRDWQAYQITGEVADDADVIYFGVLLSGDGKVWVDSASLEVLPPLNASTSPLSSEARSYLAAALDIMQQNSVNRDGLDWPALRARAVNRAAGAQRPADTYPAIRAALAELGDHHSFLMTPRAAQTNRSGGATYQDASARLLDGGIGYVPVPTYGGSEPEAMRRFARAMQDAISHLDAQGVCGWVVDLRGNRGGNMWPMLAGIGPVLGEGWVGAWVSPGDHRARWGYRDGASVGESGEVVRVPGTAYRLRRPDAPVAVLTDSLTASSGEIIVVSFRGRPDTRSFGQPTTGVSTANQTYALPDSAQIFLTVARDADRSGVRYGERVEPDERVVAEPGRDAPLETATRWLRATPACRR